MIFTARSPLFFRILKVDENITLLLMFMFILALFLTVNHFHLFPLLSELNDPPPPRGLFPGNLPINPAQMAARIFPRHAEFHGIASSNGVHESVKPRQKNQVISPSVAVGFYFAFF